MDPIAIFGIATGVLQVIDCAGNAASLILQVYKNGKLFDKEDIKALALRLKDVMGRVQRPLSLEQQTFPRTGAEGEVLGLATECQKIADELLAELRILESQGRKRNVILDNLKLLRKRLDIEKMQRKLSDYKDLLNTGILVRLMEQNDVLAQIQSDHFQQLDRHLQQFIITWTEKQAEIVDHIKSNSVAVRDRIVSEHAATRVALASSLRNQSDESISVAQQKRLLRSLRDAEIYARLNQVSETSFDTFNWIFNERRGTQDVQWPSFPTWLSQGGGIYWIQGKAGSGKSTLVKFIHDNEKTRSCLESVNPHASVRILSHFFWLAGTACQRSLHGFLCSMLYQILNDKITVLWLLQERPDFCEKSNVMDWSVNQLSDVLLKAFERNRSSNTYLILVDGLDEFGEDDKFDELTDLLFKINCYGHVRLCTSSRPEYKIVNFLENVQPLRLQDLTRPDIKTFVEGEMNQIADRVALDRLTLHGIIEEIIDKSDGVFLWARLALQNIARGLSRSDTAKQLAVRISRLPRDLEKLYQQMLDKLGEDKELYRQEAAFYLKMCQMAARYDYHTAPSTSNLLFTVRLSVLTMTLAMNQFTAKKSMELKGIDDILAIVQQCKRTVSRLNLCSGGLIEVREIYEPNSRPGDVWVREGRVSGGPQDLARQLTHYQFSTISFSHRTVLDFLDTPTGVQILDHCRISEYCLHITTIQAVLVHALTSYNDIDMSERFVNFSKGLGRIAAAPNSAGGGELDIFRHSLRIAMQALVSSRVPSTGPITVRRVRELELDFMKSCRDVHVVDIVGLWVTYGLYEVFPQSPITISNDIQMKAAHLDPDYATYLLWCASTSARSLPILLQPLLDAGASLNAQLAAPAVACIPSSPWSGILLMANQNEDARCWAASVVETCLQYGASLDQRLAIRVKLAFEPDPFIPYRVVWGLQHLSGYGYHFVLSTNIRFFIKNLMKRWPCSDADTETYDRIIAWKPELAINPQPCLVTYTNEEGQVSLRKTTQAASKTVFAIIQNYAQQKTEQAFDQMQDLATTLFSKSQPTTWKEWCSREGVNQEDHPRMQRGPYKRFKNITEEEYEQYQRKLDKEWEGSEWMTKPYDT